MYINKITYKIELKDVHFERLPPRLSNDVFGRRLIAQIGVSISNHVEDGKSDGQQ